MDPNYIPELLLRGGAIGLLILTGVLLAKSGKGLDSLRLGAIFCLGSAAYVIESSPVLQPAGGLYLNVILFLSMFNCVFFWWFAHALLKDGFCLKAWCLAPMVPILILYLIRIGLPGSAAAAWVNPLLQIVTIGLMLHVLWFTISDRRMDLIEQRRTFRVVFTMVLGWTFIAVSVVEFFIDENSAPLWLTTFHGFELFFLTLAFLVWLLQPSTPMIEELAHSQRAEKAPETPPADQYDLQRLESLMNNGYYTREGLSIKELAETLELPEHRLRRLINQSLGYRNFAAYLNSHRLGEAKQILRDPKNARKQIAQIAFDLGYGSITPFNRAFRELEGMTPTEYRKSTLAQQQTATQH